MRRATWIICALLLSASAALSQTTVSDTLTRPGGSAAVGTITLSWPAFTTQGGTQVAAGSTTITLAANGSFSTSLQPNQNATPSGTYYKAVFTLDDGTDETEYWVVPTTTPATLAQVRSSSAPSVITPVGGGAGGLQDPGTNGILKRTSLNTTAVSTYSDILGLWSGCSLTTVLAGSGNCIAVITGSGTTNTFAVFTNGTVVGNSDLVDTLGSLITFNVPAQFPNQYRIDSTFGNALVSASTGMSSLQFGPLGDLNESINAGTNLHVNNANDLKQFQYCGTTTTCSATRATAPQVVYGTVTLSGGSAVITGISPAFASTSSYACAATDTTSAAAVKVAHTSTSSITITGTGTDVIDYQCTGT